MKIQINTRVWWDTRGTTSIASTVRTSLDMKIFNIHVLILSFGPRCPFARHTALFWVAVLEQLQVNAAVKSFHRTWRGLQEHTPNVTAKVRETFLAGPLLSHLGPSVSLAPASLRLSQHHRESLTKALRLEDASEAVRRRDSHVCMITS